MFPFLLYIKASFSGFSLRFSFLFYPRCSQIPQSSDSDDCCYRIQYRRSKIRREVCWSYWPKICSDSAMVSDFRRIRIGSGSALHRSPLPIETIVCLLWYFYFFFLWLLSTLLFHLYGIFYANFAESSACLLIKDTEL